MNDGHPLSRVSGLPFGVGLDPSRRHLAVAVGDLLVVSVLIFYGVVHHYVAEPGASGILGALPPAGHVAAVVGPFLVGWVVAAVLAGAYTRAALASPLAAVVNGVGTWVLAALLGSALRATPLFPGGAPPIFILAVLGTGTVGFVLWRGVVGYLIDR